MTKPLDVGGAIVQGLRVRFDGGRAVEIDADENAEALRRRCATDDGAARLGEVALVDGRSRIGRLGRTFFNTLLDENAASHVALGGAFASPIADPADLPRINESAIHVDFMVGSDDVTVSRRDPRRRRAAAACRRGVADLTYGVEPRPLVHVEVACGGVRVETELEGRPVDDPARQDPVERRLAANAR